MRVAPLRPRGARACVLACLLTLLWFAGVAAAQEPTTDLVVVPSALVTVTDDAVTFAALGSQVSYLAGLGWTTGWAVPAPEATDAGGAIVTAETAALLRLPRIAGVRSGLDGATTRLVVDLLDLPEGHRARLGGVDRDGVDVGPGRPLVWTLPPLALPVSPASGVLFARDGLRFEARVRDGVTTLALDAPDARADAFALRAPDRIVVDLVPAAPVDETAVAGGEGRELSPGVRYRRLSADGSDGPTVVHLVELDPRQVELRVVASSGEGRTVAGWADGAVAAINAGYFDPASFASIGLRRVAGSLLSWPSRGRAAVGFGASGTVVTRASARAQIDVDGVRVADLRLDDRSELSWSAVPGSRVGSARVGVLVLDGEGRVVSNTIGPRVVPEGGSALAYPADVRPLALVEPGRSVGVDARLLPDTLERSRFAVEAGPLLVQDGRPAFEPELEGFARGQRILDEATQQAALGVRPDGTVLMVVAERMIAEDLVPLFLELGAQAALRLDSGSSATLVADGRTVNRLLARPVESAIVAVPAAEAGRRR
jgi:exopolysaccharide biosynthesis protein